MNSVLIVTGTCGSGKSTVTALMAEAGWLRVSEDTLWQDIFGNHRGAFGSTEHRTRRRQVHREVFDTVLGGLQRSRQVVIDATVHESPPEAFLEYRASFENRNISWSLRVLHPTLEVAIERDSRRSGWHAGRDRVSSLYAKFTGEVFDSGFFLDTSYDTPEQTMQRLLAGA
jgi:predicted kinase